MPGMPLLMPLRFTADAFAMMLTLHTSAAYCYAIIDTLIFASPLLRVARCFFCFDVYYFRYMAYAYFDTC